MYSHLTVLFFGCVNGFEELLVHPIQLFSDWDRDLRQRPVSSPRMLSAKPCLEGNTIVA